MLLRVAAALLAAVLAGAGAAGGQAGLAALRSLKLDSESSAQSGANALFVEAGRASSSSPARGGSDLDARRNFVDAWRRDFVRRQNGDTRDEQRAFGDAAILLELPEENSGAAGTPAPGLTHAALVSEFLAAYTQPPSSQLGDASAAGEAPAFSAGLLREADAGAAGLRGSDGDASVPSDAKRIAEGAAAKAEPVLKEAAAETAQLAKNALAAATPLAEEAWAGTKQFASDVAANAKPVAEAAWAGTKRLASDAAAKAKPVAEAAWAGTKQLAGDAAAGTKRAAAWVAPRAAKLGESAATAAWTALKGAMARAPPPSPGPEQCFSCVYALERIAQLVAPAQPPLHPPRRQSERLAGAPPPRFRDSSLEQAQAKGLPAREWLRPIRSVSCGQGIPGVSGTAPSPEDCPKPEEAAPRRPHTPPLGRFSPGVGLSGGGGSGGGGNGVGAAATAASGAYNAVGGGGMAGAAHTGRNVGSGAGGLTGGGGVAGGVAGSAANVAAKASKAGVAGGAAAGAATEATAGGVAGGVAGAATEANGAGVAVGAAAAGAGGDAGGSTEAAASGGGEAEQGSAAAGGAAAQRQPGAGRGKQASNGRRTGKQASNGRRPGKQASNGRRPGKQASNGRRPGKQASNGRRPGKQASNGRRPGKQASNGRRPGKQASNGRRPGKQASNGRRPGKQASNGRRPGKQASNGRRVGRLASAMLLETGAAYYPYVVGQGVSTYWAAGSEGRWGAADPRPQPAPQPPYAYPYDAQTHPDSPPPLRAPVVGAELSGGAAASWGGPPDSGAPHAGLRYPVAALTAAVAARRAAYAAWQQRQQQEQQYYAQQQQQLNARAQAGYYGAPRGSVGGYDTGAAFSPFAQPHYPAPSIGYPSANSPSVHPYGGSVGYGGMPLTESGAPTPYAYAAAGHYSRVPLAPALSVTARPLLPGEVPQSLVAQGSGPWGEAESVWQKLTGGGGGGKGGAKGKGGRGGKGRFADTELVTEGTPRAMGARARISSSSSSSHVSSSSRGGAALQADEWVEADVVGEEGGGAATAAAPAAAAAAPPARVAALRPTPQPQQRVGAQQGLGGRQQHQAAPPAHLTGQFYRLSASAVGAQAGGHSESDAADQAAAWDAAHTAGATGADSAAGSDAAAAGASGSAAASDAADQAAAWAAAEAAVSGSAWGGEEDEGGADAAAVVAAGEANDAGAAESAAAEAAASEEDAADAAAWAAGAGGAPSWADVRAMLRAAQADDGLQGAGSSGSGEEEGAGVVPPRLRDLGLMMGGEEEASSHGGGFGGAAAAADAAASAADAAAAAALAEIGADAADRAAAASWADGVLRVGAGDAAAAGDALLQYAADRALLQHAADRARHPPAAAHAAAAAAAQSAPATAASDGSALDSAAELLLLEVGEAEADDGAPGYARGASGTALDGPAQAWAGGKAVPFRDVAGEREVWAAAQGQQQRSSRRAPRRTPLLFAAAPVVGKRKGAAAVGSGRAEPADQWLYGAVLDDVAAAQAAAAEASFDALVARAEATPRLPAWAARDAAAVSAVQQRWPAPRPWVHRAVAAAPQSSAAATKLKLRLPKLQLRLPGRRGAKAAAAARAPGTASRPSLRPLSYNLWEGRSEFISPGNGPARVPQAAKLAAAPSAASGSKKSGLLGRIGGSMGGLFGGSRSKMGAAAGLFGGGSRSKGAAGSLVGGRKGKGQSGSAAASGKRSSKKSGKARMSPPQRRAAQAAVGARVQQVARLPVGVRDIGGRDADPVFGSAALLSAGGPLASLAAAAPPFAEPASAAAAAAAAPGLGRRGAALGLGLGRRGAALGRRLLSVADSVDDAAGTQAAYDAEVVAEAEAAEAQKGGILEIPMPHACRPGTPFCRQRHRQPSLPHLMRRQRRTEAKAARSRIFVAYAYALGRLCTPDEEGIGSRPTRTVPTPESRMAGYPVLLPELRRSGGHFVDEWSHVRETTSHGDHVGVGTLRHYAFPARMRAFCPALRAKLGVVADRLVHGYDVEETCVALAWCTAEHVGHIFRPGDPTSLKGRAYDYLPGLMKRKKAEPSVVAPEQPEAGGS